MRRGVHTSSKSTWDSDDIVSFKTASPIPVDTKKFRKIKDVENETRCHSAQNELRDSERQHETARTRSVSPKSHVPPVDGKLPLKKFYKIYSKIVVQLETVKTFTETKKNESENLIDLRRQLQRADEFSIRFSRNNLYETRRIINEIKQLIAPYPFEALSPGQCKLLCQKIIYGYQAASQSLQTYINYCKNPSNLEVPDKINELVLLIADLFLCCEHVSLPPHDAYIKNDAVKVCNDLMSLLKSKIPVCEYVELKEESLTKKKPKSAGREKEKIKKKLFMYQPKFTAKPKPEAPKKKVAVPCLLGVRKKKVKKDEVAKTTHEIYTQKLHPCQGKALTNKNVKFRSESDEKNDNIVDKKVPTRRHKYVTPREVRSQDDDVETMVQTIGDDEVSQISKIGSTPREIDEDKTNFKQLLLEAIQGLQSTDRKEYKITLNKLLTTIKNCTKPPNPPNDRIKVLYLKSQDLLNETDNNEETAQVENNQTIPEVDPKINDEKTKSKLIFKPLVENNDQREIKNRGRVKLKISEDTMREAIKYKKAFAEYRKNNIMYKKTLSNKPWELVGKITDCIILDLIKEISLDFQNDAILKRLYLSELLEVTS